LLRFFFPFTNIAFFFFVSQPEDIDIAEPLQSPVRVEGPVVDDNDEAFRFVGVARLPIQRNQQLCFTLLLWCRRLSRIGKVVVMLWQERYFCMASLSTSLILLA
jgi:hypothetical protein